MSVSLGGGHSTNLLLRAARSGILLPEEMDHMSAQQAAVKKLQAALPLVLAWINDLLRDNEAKALPVATAGFQRLANHFPGDILTRSTFVIVPRVPFPPLTELGLQELAAMEKMRLAGITFRDTFFVHESHRTESLFAHELIHVLQWKRLGAENFLLAYGVGLVQFGYERSPLEEMAYTMQRNFDNGKMPTDVVGIVNERTDAVWRQVAAALPR